MSPEPQNQWTEKEVLIDIAVSLSEIRTLLERLLTTERTGAVSSVEMKFTAKGEPQPVVKAYTGSVVPVDEALDAYQQTIEQANERFMKGLQATIDSLPRK